MEHKGPTVEVEDIDALMARVQYVTESRPGGTTSTFVHAFLDGKFHLATGRSACVDPSNFNAEYGEAAAQLQAQRAARDKLWELEGYILYTNLRRSK